MFESGSIASPEVEPALTPATHGSSPPISGQLLRRTWELGPLQRVAYQDAGSRQVVPVELNRWETKSSSPGYGCGGAGCGCRDGTRLGIAHAR